MYIVIVELKHLSPTSCPNCRRRRLQIPEQTFNRLTNNGVGGFWCKHFNTCAEAMNNANDWLRQLNADFEGGGDGFSPDTEDILNNPNIITSSRRQVWDEDLFTVTIAKEANE